MTWKCANCGKDYDIHLHGASLSIPVCERCAKFYLMGVAAGSVAAYDMKDVERSVDVSIMKMVDDGMIEASSVTHMGVRE